MDTNLHDLERSEPSPRDFRELIKNITKDSVQKRLSYTPQFKGNELTLRLYVDVHADGTASPC